MAQNLGMLSLPDYYQNVASEEAHSILVEVRVAMRPKDFKTQKIAKIPKNLDFQNCMQESMTLL